jgi:hypothetical protein
MFMLQFLQPRDDRSSEEKGEDFKGLARTALRLPTGDRWKLVRPLVFSLQQEADLGKTGRETSSTAAQAD